MIAVDEPLVINATLTSTPLVSRDQRIVVTDTGAFGGVPPYNYQWQEFYSTSGLPITSIVPPNCQAPESLTCTFVTNATTPLGQYSFRLEAMDNESPIQTVYSSPAYVTVDPALVITSFYSTNTFISVGQGTTLINTTTGGTGSDVWAYSLISGPAGGFVNTGGNKYNFTQAGTYNIKLYATDKSGENATANALVVVTPVLKVSLNANRTYISPAQSIKISNTTSGGTGSNIFTTTVNNTAGVVQNGNVFTFNNQGTYVITTQVKDLSGEVNQSSLKITVTAPLMTKINANTTYISTGQSVKLSKTTTRRTGY